MNKTYEVGWSKISEKDLVAIIEYIADENPSRAYEVFREIRRKASNLSAFSERGLIVPEFEDQGITQYRELVIPPWRIIYRVSERKVYVLSVLDSRRNIEDILLKRLINLKL
jgi:plasmid stabilization system protein ParE